MCDLRWWGSLGHFRLSFKSRFTFAAAPFLNSLWPFVADMELGFLLGESGAAFDAAARRVASASTCRGVASPRVDRSIFGKKSAHRRPETVCQFASWNVRSLLNATGPLETAFARGCRASRDFDDRRIDSVVSELARLRI